jgi:hypothetical protein
MIDARIRKKNILTFYLIYRFMVMLIALLVVARLTILGDTSRYVSATVRGTMNAVGYTFLIDRDYLADFVVALLKTVLFNNIFLTHIFFNLIAFWGVKMVVDVVEIPSRRRFNFLIFLIFFPSFNIWSSVASKEAIIVWSMGVVVSRLIRYFRGEKFKLNFLILIALYFLCVIKTQYVAALLQLLLYIKVVQTFNIRGYLEILLILLVVALNALILYLARDLLDAYSKLLVVFFTATARSTRPNPFINKYDFFRLMPYGMGISFWGPKWGETRTSILHLFSFFESLVLVAVLLYYIKDTVYLFLIRMKIYYRRMFLAFNTLFWLLFAQYIQGIMNPGAAIRYRTNLYLLVIVLFYYLFYASEKARNMTPQAERRGLPEEEEPGDEDF